MAAGEDLELLPVLGFEVLVIKAIQPLLPREMSLAQQALAPGNQAVVNLLLTERIEELGRAPTFCLSLLAERLPVAAKAREFQLFEQEWQGRFHCLGARDR